MIANYTTSRGGNTMDGAFAGVNFDSFVLPGVANIQHSDLIGETEPYLR